VENSLVQNWPDIPYLSWKDTAATLHQWLQIVGKYRLAYVPWVNHSWHATLYLCSRGLTTSVIHTPVKSVQVDFDFIDHRLRVVTSDADEQSIPLHAMSVAKFHRQFRECVNELGVGIAFHGIPNEIEGAIPFERNTAPGAYDADAVHRFWRALLQVDRVLKRFRSGFLGKVSPVHLFWGSFDLAVTRFSGRNAPVHPGGIPALPDAVTREAYSHEVSSAGFWAGGGPIEFPAFYSYAYPAPKGFSSQVVTPAGAYFDETLGEFLLPYDAVRTADDPDAVLLGFLQSTYEAAANLAGWPRDRLECPPGRPRIVRPVQQSQ
jgi:hypothetical protein